MSQILTQRNLYAGVPSTARGEPSHISCDPTGNTDLIVYASGRVVVLRSIKDPLLSHVFSLHSSPVTCARFSPDASEVASADESGNVRIWDTKTLSQKKEISAMAGAIRDIAFSSNGKFLIVAGESRGAFAKVFKLPSGGSAGTCMGHSKRTLACDTAGGFVATGSEDMSAGLFKGPPVREIDIAKFLRHHTGFIIDVKFSPDASKLAIASSDRTASIINVATNEVICTISDHSASVTGVFWIDDTKLITSSNDKSTRLWKVPEGECLSTTNFGSNVMDMQVGCGYSKKSGDIISVSLRPQVNVIGRGQDEVTSVLRGHCKQIVGLAVVGNKAYSADYSGLLVAWDIDVGPSDKVFNGKGPLNCVTAIAANEEVVANVGQDGRVFVSSTDNLTYNKPIIVKGGGIGIAVAKNTMGDFSAIMVNETRLTAINEAADGIAAEHKFGNGENGCCVAVSSDGCLIAVGMEVSGGSGELRFFSIQGNSFSQEGQTICMPSPPNRISFCPNGEVIAVGEKSRRVRLYSVKTRMAVTGGGLAHTARVDAICFSPDGTLAASGGMDGSVAVWPINSEDEPVRLKTAHRNGVTGISFNSQNSIITSGGDSCLRTWNL